MAGRHRSGGRPWPLGQLLSVLLALGVGVAGYAYSEEIAALLPHEAPERVATSPSPSPSPSPTGTPTPEPKPRGKLLIHGTGDVNMDPSYIPDLAANGYGYAWSGLDGLFERDDLTVVNLECAISTGGSPLPKEFTFRGPPESLPPMAQAGVEVANLGNNHAYDFGPEALLDSRRHLLDAGIAAVGAGKDIDQSLRAATFRLKRWRVAVVGLDMVVDPFPEALATEDKPGTAAGHDTGLMLRAIREAERRADLVIVTIHWGVELDTQPRPEQVELGHRFVEAGADIIFGHHAHRLQPMDTYHGRPIFWGLGNFVWPNFSVEGSTTAVAQVIVRRNGTLDGRLLPAYIQAPGHPVLTG
jgi:poly-gamma-glutamate capsule biosynthesis protein CapA/YwtB (metallophosphatase superfamily)